MKIRLDELIVKRNFVSSLKEAQALILSGQVLVNEKRSDKPGNIHNESDVVSLKQKCRFVSRGGLKLEKALHHFNFNVDNLICADIGASSGGFTDCLLQYGAARVYAVDVAYGQFSWSLRQDKKVVVIERFNARKLTVKEISEPLDLAVIDASFISLTKLIPPLIPLLSKNKHILALIKPQFELHREKVEKGGVVRSEVLHDEAIDKIRDFASMSHLTSVGVVPSPILGPKGNKEFIIFLKAAVQ